MSYEDRYGAIHKRRPRRGWEGGCRNPDKPEHRKGGFIRQPGRPSLKKNKNKKHICIYGTKRY